MTPTRKLVLFMYILCLEISDYPGRIKRFIWNKKVLMWWNRLWIRENELHSSLDMDHEAMLEMTEEGCNAYLKDLFKIRSIALQRDSAKR